MTRALRKAATQSQVAVQSGAGDPANEITTVPKLLELLSLKGYIVMAMR